MHEAEAAVGGVFNIGTGQATNLLELLAVFGGRAGRDVGPVFGRPGAVTSGVRRARWRRLRLGYRPIVRLAEGLYKTVAWHHGHHGK